MHKRSSTVLIIFLLCLLSWACGDKPVTPDTTQPAVPPSRDAFILAKGKMSPSLQLPGELIAWQQVDVYAKVNSFVKKLYVDVGSEVHAGELLVTMEAPEISSQLSGAESRLKSQEAIYTASKATYDRVLETSKTPGTISANDLEQAAAKMNSDRSQFEAAKSAYNEILDNQKYLEVRAPFNGVISARNINPGAYVGPSGKGSELPMLILQEQKHLRLVISVPEAYTGYLTNKSTVQFTVKALPDQVFHAAVKRMAGALDNRLRAERIEMDVPNDNKKLLPGMVAEVLIPVGGQDSSLIIPKTALVNSTERVFVVRVTNEKAEWVDVKPGREAGDKIEIFGNLQPGDTILRSATDETRNHAPSGKLKIIQVEGKQ